MGTFVFVRWAFASLEFLLGLYMAIFAHFPTYYVFFWQATPYYFKTSYILPDTYGIWVRIAGGCFVVGFLMMALGEFNDNLPLLLATMIVHGAGSACLLVSFFNNRTK